MKLDRNHVKGDLHQQTFRHIVEYTMSKENKYIIPIVHIKSHVGTYRCKCRKWTLFGVLTYFTIQ